MLPIYETAVPSDTRVRAAIEQTRSFAAGALDVAEAVLARMAEGEAVQRVRVTAGRKGDFKYAIK